MGSRTPPPNAAKLLNPYFPVSPPHTSRKRRVLRALAWTAAIAVASTVCLVLSVLAGVAAPAAGVSMGMFIGKEVLMSAGEGLLFAIIAEHQGNRAAAAALANAMRAQVHRPARKLTVAELEAEIQQIEAQLQTERRAALEASR